MLALVHVWWDHFWASFSCGWDGHKVDESKRVLGTKYFTPQGSVFLLCLSHAGCTSMCVSGVCYFLCPTSGFEVKGLRGSTFEHMMSMFSGSILHIVALLMFNKILSKHKQFSKTHLFFIILCKTDRKKKRLLLHCSCENCSPCLTLKSEEKKAVFNLWLQFW